MLLSNKIREILHSTYACWLDKGYWFTRLVNSKSVSDLEKLYSELVSEYKDGKYSKLNKYLLC